MLLSEIISLIEVDFIVSISIDFIEDIVGSYVENDVLIELDGLCEILSGLLVTIILNLFPDNVKGEPFGELVV